MGKFLDDKGRVGVLLSPGFGAGWSTWNQGIDFDWVFDKGLVELALRKANKEDVLEYLKEKGIDRPYLCGWDDIIIIFLGKGTMFTIKEYDGSESLLLVENLTLVA